MRRASGILVTAVLVAACGASNGTPVPASPTPSPGQPWWLSTASPAPPSPAVPPPAAASPVVPDPTIRPIPAGGRASVASPVPTDPPIGPKPEFAPGALVTTVSDNVAVRSRPGVSAESIIYRPWLRTGTILEVERGPVAASGYWWYHVALVDGTELNRGVTEGWVAAADHDGEPWIGWEDGVGTDAVEVPVYADFPDPELAVTGVEYDAGGDGLPYTYYALAVVNWADYPATLFAASPDLPPCGLNASASRTWVDIVGYDDATEEEARIYGFCALDDPESLEGLWFAVPRGSPPPSSVYVTLWDRLEDRLVQSNWVTPPWPLPEPPSTPSPSPSPGG